MRPRLLRFRGVLVALGLCACSGATAPGSLPAPSGALLAPGRIAALPAPVRAAWTRYLERSSALRRADREALEAELRRLGRDTLASAPAARALVVEDEHTDEWFRGEEARALAEAILSYQTPSGGWSKSLALRRPRAPGESFSTEGTGYIATFDNDATTEQLRFLARVYRARGDERHRAALLKGLDFLLAAQFPNGCWPQVYPLQGGYHDAVTLNDDAMVNVLRVERELASDPAVPDPVRERLRVSLNRGVDCLLGSQVVVEGTRTVWGAQHDPLTLRPVAGRSYEPASLAPRESAAVLLFLMEWEHPCPAGVTEAVEAGAAWLRENAIHGFEYESGRELTARPGAGPLWARFYEIGSNRPIFSNRDGVVRYSWHELEGERRYGYAWYTDEPERVLRRLERWRRSRREHGERCAN